MSGLPISALSALGSDFAIAPVRSLGTQPIPTAGAGSTNGGGGFAGALGNALQALQQTQTTADSAATQLATGQATDPTAAVAAVENAQLAMELASQISNKAVAAVQTILQTQV